MIIMATNDECSNSASPSRSLSELSASLLQIPKGSNHSKRSRNKATFNAPGLSLTSPLAPTQQSFDEYYEKGDRIAAGGFGTVHVAQHKATSQEFAVKVIDRKLLSDENTEKVHAEVNILKECNSVQGIVRLVDFYESPTHFYMVQVYAQGGDVFERLAERANYTERDARDLASCLLGIVKGLHDKRIAHRDLKPENLLLKSKNDDTQILVADFGFAKYVNREQGIWLTTRCGTVQFVAPEVLEDNAKYDEKADCWSVGCLLYMLIAGYPPFQSKNNKSQLDLYREIRGADFCFHDRYWKNVSIAAKQLIASLLTVNPQDRCSAAEALHDSNWMMDTSTSALLDADLTPSIGEMIKFNGKRKIKAAILSVLFGMRLRLLAGSMNKSGPIHFDFGGGGGDDNSLVDDDSISSKEMDNTSNEGDEFAEETEHGDYTSDYTRNQQPKTDDSVDVLASTHSRRSSFRASRGSLGLGNNRRMQSDTEDMTSLHTEDESDHPAICEIEHSALHIASQTTQSSPMSPSGRSRRNKKSPRKQKKLQHTSSQTSLAKRLTREFSECYDLGKALYEGGTCTVWECVPRQAQRLQLLRDQSTHSANSSNHSPAQPTVSAPSSLPPLVVKIIDKESLHEDPNTDPAALPLEEGQPLNEAIFLSHLGSHPHIMTLYDQLEDEDFYYLVMPQMHGADLFDYVVKKKRLDEMETRRILKSLLEAVAHVHAQGICHRDLSPMNVLLKHEAVLDTDSSPTLQQHFDANATNYDSNYESGDESVMSGASGHHSNAGSTHQPQPMGRKERRLARKKAKKAKLPPIQNMDLCLSDFSLACPVLAPQSLTRRCGAGHYVSPEILKNVPYDQSTDLWSIGVVAYICLSGYMPFDEEDAASLCSKIRIAEYDFPPEEWNAISEDAKDFIKHLLVADPKRRWTAEQALQSKWMGGRPARRGLGRRIKDALSGNSSHHSSRGGSGSLDGSNHVVRRGKRRDKKNWSFKKLVKTIVLMNKFAGDNNNNEQQGNNEDDNNSGGDLSGSFHCE